MSHETWAQILARKTTVSASLEQGLISVKGEEEDILRFLAAFEHEGLR